MTDLISPARVADIAAGARVALAADAPSRIANVALGNLQRYAAADIAVPFEVEPSTFAVVQGGEIGR